MVGAPRGDQPTHEGVAVTAGEVARALGEHGYVFADAKSMAVLLEAAGLTDWEDFAASWDDLGVDGFMADGGRYRRRRFACFAVSSSAIARKPHQPHYQSRDYNPLNGGIERWFAPIVDGIAGHPVLRAVLTTTHALFESLTPAATRPEEWHVEVHQFRIEAGAEVGRPTPEGVHKDGVDWVMVMLVRRENIASGETLLEDNARGPLGSFVLTEPMDSALVDDARVFHGVTPVMRVDDTKPAHRDVLVVTYRRA